MRKLILVSIVGMTVLLSGSVLAQTNNNIHRLKNSPMVKGYTTLLTPEHNAGSTVSNPNSWVSIYSDAAGAVSVTSGVVASVFKISDKEGGVVIIMAADTFFVYKNLDNISVTNHEKVSVGTKIGTVLRDDVNYLLELSVWQGKKNVPKATEKWSCEKIIGYLGEI